MYFNLFWIDIIVVGKKRLKMPAYDLAINLHIVEQNQSMFLFYFEMHFWRDYLVFSKQNTVQNVIWQLSFNLRTIRTWPRCTIQCDDSWFISESRKPLCWVLEQWFSTFWAQSPGWRIFLVTVQIKSLVKLISIRF